MPAPVLQLPQVAEWSATVPVLPVFSSVFSGAPCGIARCPTHRVARSAHRRQALSRPVEDRRFLTLAAHPTPTRQLRGKTGRAPDQTGPPFSQAPVVHPMFHKSRGQTDRHRQSPAVTHPLPLGKTIATRPKCKQMDHLGKCPFRSFYGPIDSSPYRGITRFSAGCVSVD